MLKIKYYVFAVLMFLSHMGSTYAADFPTPPQRPFTFNNEVTSPQFRTYVGVNVSGLWAVPSKTMKYDSNVGLGVKTGVETQYVGAYVAYDHFIHNRHSHRNMVSFVPYVKYDIGRFTPYVGAGVGYTWVNDRYTKDYVNYVVTGGVKTQVAWMTFVDLSYRYVNSFDKPRAAHIMSVGIEKRF